MTFITSVLKLLPPRQDRADETASRMVPQDYPLPGLIVSDEAAAVTRGSSTGLGASLSTQRLNPLEKHRVDSGDPGFANRDRLSLYEGIPFYFMEVTQDVDIAMPQESLSAYLAQTPLSHGQRACSRRSRLELERPECGNAWRIVNLRPNRFK
ncbi:hypothetical protein BD779DRAFT_1684935 [Infundibulicybe gibba]|nr:hypothetical protein BD779DRAFT_1684935 [Infundibulicybe gibba]